MKFTFDAYAMIKPSKPEHLLALLQEASAELDNMQEHLDSLVDACEKSKQAA